MYAGKKKKGFMMETINIGFTVTDNYAQHLAATMSSILSNTSKDTKFNFYVMNEGDITFETKRRISLLKNIHDFNIKYITVKKEDFREYSPGVHMSTNYRLKVASLIPEADKILFLDVDLIVLDDIANLWNTDISDYYMAAVPDPCQIYQFQVVRSKFIDKFPTLMYNTGVILLNLKKWREDDIEEKLLHGIKWFSANYDQCWPDQSTLNMVLKDKIKQLDGRWNACPLLGYIQQPPGAYDSIEQRDLIFANPAIIHYAADQKYKAWLDSSLPWADVYWEYLRKTPYYEAGILNMVKNAYKYELSDIHGSLGLLKQQNVINFKYKKYRVLKNLTFGKTAKRYREKCSRFRALVNEIQAIS